MLWQAKMKIGPANYAKLAHPSLHMFEKLLSIFLLCSCSVLFWVYKNNTLYKADLPQLGVAFVHDMWLKYQISLVLFELTLSVRCVDVCVRLHVWLRLFYVAYK